jgi:hypothetical protein
MPSRRHGGVLEQCEVIRCSTSARRRVRASQRVVNILTARCSQEVQHVQTVAGDNMVSFPHEGSKMSALKSLTFTTLPKIGANPTLDRRTNMIARLEEQKLLLNDPNYIRTARTWVKKNGELTPIQRQQRVLPWWRVNADGSYVFFVRLGSKPIEFEKGKNAIAVPSLDKMPLVINILITAVRNGELDQQLAQTKKPATVPKYLDKTVNNLITMIETMTDISRVESQGAV